MHSPERAKRTEVLSRASNILGKRPHSQFNDSDDSDEIFDADDLNSSARRLRRKLQKTSASLTELRDLPSLSLNGDQEPVTRFEHRQHEQEVVDQSRGVRKGSTGNQPQQFATRAMTRPRSQQRMLKVLPDSQVGTAPKGYQSIAGPSRTSNHRTGGDTAYANLEYDEIAVNPKTASTRERASPSNTTELGDGPVKVTPSLRLALTRDYKEDRPNLVHKKKYSCKDCSYSSVRSHNMKRHVITTHGGIRVRTKSDRTNFSSSSSSEKLSKTETYEGTLAKANDARHYSPLPSSRTAYIPRAQINPALMGGMPPGMNLNPHALQHLGPAAQQQMLQQQLQQQHFNNPQAVAAMRQQQQQLIQQQQARQLMAQQAAFQANRQDGLPIEMAKSSQLNPKGHYLHAEVILAQQLALQQHQQEQQEQKRQGRQPLAEGSDILIDTAHFFMDIDQTSNDLEKVLEDADHSRQTLSWDNKESTDKRVDGTRRLKADLRDPSANFSSIGHYTISQDNTEGEEARKSLLLAKFGKRCTRNRDAEELEKQKALRRDRFSF